jgi:hypothetical protein
MATSLRSRNSRWFTILFLSVVAFAIGTIRAQVAPPAPQDTGPKIGYENFAAPGVLVPAKTSEGGQQPNSVEWMGRNAGEPSVGADFATGVATYQSGFQTLFATFDDTCPTSGLAASWACRPAPNALALDSDPIGFTDRGYTDLLGTHSRVFAAQLTFLSPDTVKIAYTDDDGVTWVPTQTGGIASAVDHETIGGGIYHSPIPSRPPGTIYPNAIYYCSQDIAAALCARSDDGGLTYGASVPIYELTSCGGLHGHVKVSPVDGTVYVPNRSCGGAAVVVSQNNGVTWTVRDVQDASGLIGSAPDDPAVGIDSNGRVYFLASIGGNTPTVATSDDFGATWQNIYELGSALGIQNMRFPAAVGGSAGRAAVAFYGATGGSGDSDLTTFTGVWHLYVAHTFDGGLHWTTTDATPNAPMQRTGILNGSNAYLTRNLLDFFDMTVDRDGRVMVGYVDGCEGGNCKQAAPTAKGNAYTVTATIARQSSGRRLFAVNDPVATTEAPGMPSVTQRRVGRAVHLGWSEADTGNSPITGYRIQRSTDTGATWTTITTVAGTQTGGTFDDLTATDTTKTYSYLVQATNAIGMSCPNNRVDAPYIGDGCTGIVIHQNEAAHREANAGTNTPASLLIDYIAVGEPASAPNSFLFKMKVNSLASIPINSRWRVMFDPPSASDSGLQYYVGMTTSETGSPVFEYGTLTDAGVPAVFVIGETQQGSCTVSGTSCTISGAGAPSQYNPDGTITIIVPKSAFGNPQPGDLLSAIGGRTFTGDTPGSPESTLERSNTFVDHTFVKAQTDNSYPAATYTVLGNTACEGGIVPTAVVSRKTHGGVDTFDVPLPVSGPVGIECRSQGTTHDHTVVVTFAVPVTVSGNGTVKAQVTSGTGQVGTNGVANGNAVTVTGTDVTVPLTNVADAQRLTITIFGVNDGLNIGDVSVPMGVLLGDVNANGVLTNADVSLVKAQVASGGNVTASNFRNDVNANDVITNADVSVTKAQVAAGTQLP